MTDDAWAHERTLVLADDADLAALDRYATGRGWPRVTDRPGGYGYLRQVGWDDGDTAVLWLESGRLGVRFVCVAGPSADDVDRTAGALAGVLPVVAEDATLAELTAAEPAEPRAALRAVHRLAAQYEIRRLRAMPAAPDDRYRSMAGRVLAHPDPAVRHALVMLFADLVAVRPEVVAPIAAHTDPDPALATLVEVFREISVEKGIPVA